MIHVGRYLVVWLDSAHVNQVVSNVIPEDLEIRVLISRLFEAYVRVWHWGRIIHFVVNLHLQHKHSQVTIIRNDTLNGWILNVRAVNSADSHKLVLISDLSIRYNWLLLELSIMNVLKVFTSLE